MLKRFLSLALTLVSLATLAQKPVQPYVPVDTLTVRPPISAQPGEWWELRATPNYNGYWKLPDGTTVPAFSSPINSNDLPVKLSPAQVAAAVEPALYFDGSIWVREPGTITSATPGFGAVLNLGAQVGGKPYRYRRQYERANPKWWGVKGDNATDDTDALQAFANYQAIVHQEIDLGYGQFKTTKPLIIPNGVAGFWMDEDATIRPTGSGYTAVVTQNANRWTRFRIKVVTASTGALNGVLLNNVQRTTVDHIEVDGFRGFGVLIVKTWDANYLHISVNHCGSAQYYAFSVIGGGDTSNMSHFVRLQVENSREQAISIDGPSLCVVIDAIHSEGTICTTPRIAWHLGGVRSTYTNVRLHSVNANASVKFHGAHTTFREAQIEGAVGNVELNSWDGENSGLLEFQNLKIYSGRIEKSGNGKVLITSGKVKKIEGLVSNFTIGCDVDSLGVGYTPVGTELTVRNAVIGRMYSTDVHSKARLENCTIMGGSPAGGQTVLVGSTMYLGTNYTLGYRTMILERGSRLVCTNLTLDWAYLKLVGNSGIEGNLTLLDNNGRALIADGSAFVRGTLIGWGAPQTATYAPYGYWMAGETTLNPKRTEKGAQGYVFAGGVWALITDERYVQGINANSRATPFSDNPQLERPSGYYSYTGSATMPVDPYALNVWYLNVNHHENMTGNGGFWTLNEISNLDGRWRGYQIRNALTNAWSTYRYVTDYHFPLDFTKKGANGQILQMVNGLWTPVDFSQTPPPSSGGGGSVDYPIGDLPPGATQAQIINKINEILAALREAGIITIAN